MEVAPEGGGGTRWRRRAPSLNDAFRIVRFSAPAMSPPSWSARPDELYAAMD